MTARRKKKVVRRKRSTRPQAEQLGQQSTNGHLPVTDTLIRIEVQGGKYDGETIEMDPMKVFLASRPIEQKLKLRTVNGLMEATPEFADAMSDRLESIGYKCTPAIAIRVWMESHRMMAESQKKTS